MEPHLPMPVDGPAAATGGNNLGAAAPAPLLQAPLQAGTPRSESGGSQQQQQQQTNSSDGPPHNKRPVRFVKPVSAAWENEVSGAATSAQQQQDARDNAGAVHQQLGMLYRSYLSARDAYLHQALALLDSMNGSAAGNSAGSMTAHQRSENMAVQRALEKAAEIIQHNSLPLPGGGSGCGGVATVSAAAGGA